MFSGAPALEVPEAPGDEDDGPVDSVADGDELDVSVAGDELAAGSSTPVASDGEVVRGSEVRGLSALDSPGASAAEDPASSGVPEEVGE